MVVSKRIVNSSNCDMGPNKEQQPAEKQLSSTQDDNYDMTDDEDEKKPTAISC